MKVRVSSKGQIVLPAELRRKYGIETGSELSVVEWAGSIHLVPVPGGDPLDLLHGMLADTGYTSEQFVAERQAERDRENRAGA
jgi:AbrB family looped-hinge helix DNA binding protein